MPSDNSLGGADASSAHAAKQRRSQLEATPRYETACGSTPHAWRTKAAAAPKPRRERIFQEVQLQLEAINEIARIATSDLAHKFGWEFVALVMVNSERDAFGQ